MKKELISNVIGALDTAIIAEAATFQSPKRAIILRRRWLLPAACLLLAVALGVALGIPHLQEKPGEIFPRSYQGIVTPNAALIWPWEYKTDTERYIELSIHGTLYHSSSQRIDSARLGALIGVFEAKGWDIYENDKEYQRSCSVYSVADLPTDEAVAVELDGIYYLYVSADGLSHVEHPTLPFLAGKVTEIGDGYVMLDDTALCKDPKDGMVFKILTDDPRVSRCFAFEPFGIRVGSTIMVSFEAPLTLTEENTVDGAIRISIAQIASNGDVLIPE